MQRSLRPILLCAAMLPSGYGLVSACSLDLDESLIPGAGGDASSNDVQSFGGFTSDGSQWVDAPHEDATSDASDGATDASPDVDDGGPVKDGVDCGQSACDSGTFCCWDNGVGTCVGNAADCSAVTLGCDATSDCNVGELCCVLNVSGTVGCATSCPDTPIGAIQFCEVALECTSGACGEPSALIANLLPPGYKACQ